MNWSQNKKWTRKILIILLWVLCLPLVLLLLLGISLRLPPVQRYAADKTANYLQGKVNTKVDLGLIDLSLSGTIRLQNLYVEDPRGDTLLYFAELAVTIDPMALWSNEIRLTAVNLNHCSANIHRQATDSTFNFAFIVDAFSPAQQAPEPKSGEPPSWRLTLHKLKLNDVNLAYVDAPGGTDVGANIGKLAVDFDDFDLEHNRVKVGKLALDSSSVVYVQNVPTLLQVSDTNAVDFDIGLAKGDLSAVNFKYNDKVKGVNLRAKIGQLNVNAKKTDLGNMTFLVNNVSLAGSDVRITVQEQSGEQGAVSAASPEWLAELNNLSLKNVTFGYDHGNVISKPKGMDYDHLLVSGIYVDASAIHLDPRVMSVKLADLRAREQCGFELRKFKGTINYAPTNISLHNFALHTAHSTIGHELGITFGSLKTLVDSLENLGVLAKLANTSILLKDLLYFVPAFATDTLLNYDPTRRVELSGNIHGTLGDLLVDRFEATTGQTFVHVSGSVKNMLTPSNMFLHITAFDLGTTNTDVADILRPGVMPTSIHVPVSLQARGRFNRYLNNFDGDVRFTSTSGNADILVKVEPGNGNAARPYNGTFNVRALDLGYILGNTDLGPVTIQGTMQGQGLDSTAFGHADLVIMRAALKKYNYTNICIKGDFTTRSFKGLVTASDPNLSFEMDGMFSLVKGAPRFELTLDLQGADLRALNLSKEDIRLRAKLTSDLDLDPHGNPSGILDVRNVTVMRNGKNYHLDSLVFRSTYRDGSTDMKLTSEVLEASMKGNYHLPEIGATVMRHFNAYFDLHQQLPASKSEQSFSFGARLLNPDYVAAMVPGMDRLSAFELKGNYNSAQRQADVSFFMPIIRYQGTQLDSISLKVDANNEALLYNLSLRQVSNATLKTENAVLSGDISHNVLKFGFTTARDDSTTLLATGGFLKSKPEGYELSFNRDLIFNAGQWRVDPSNYLFFGRAGFYANQLAITDNTQVVSVNSHEKIENAPLEVMFRDFEVATVSRLIENNKELVRGRANGNVIFEKHNAANAFRSDITVTDLVFQSVPIGTVKLKADNYVDVKRYDVDLSVDGYGNSLFLKGWYGVAAADNNLDLSLDVQKFDLKTIEPFTFGEVSRLSGGLNGQLHIGGSVKSPDITGKLNLVNAGLAPRIIDSYLNIPEGQVTFGNKKMRFNQFTLLDTLSNKATLNGWVDYSTLKNPGLDLRLKTTNFLAMNTTHQDNTLYYGKIFLDGDIAITGSKDLPLLDLDVRLNKGSELTYVKPESQASKYESKGIVEFTDSLDLGNAIMGRDSTRTVRGLKGMTLQAAINVNKDVVVKMIVDPVAGDSLYLVGGGKLNLTLDQAGKVGLAGRYNINEGGYYLTISELVKRYFKIQKGSYVSWAEDPLDAYVDITAVYSVKTSPVELMESELTAGDEYTRNRYRNNLNFLVYLKMSGYVYAPQISFDIQLAPADKGAAGGSVNTRLSQLRVDETQLNKQVFALLTLKRFISENPLESGGSGGFSSASRSSASKVLTTQLNNISDRYVNFVDLDLGVNSFEDYSSGKEEGRTQLQVAVSKQLLKDKLTVKVGGNFELEGEKAQQNKASDAVGNINIDYKLTEGGEYKLKGFRETQYENPLEGDITKTGVGIVFTRNFNRFKDMFKKRDKTRTPGATNIKK